MPEYINSPLNYIGGKRKLLSQIIPLFPKNIKNFVDLFCGGCNVGINVNADKIIFNDNLSYLIDLYKAFEKHSINEILEFIENRINQFNLSLTNQEGYLEFRKFYNEQKNPLDLFVLAAFSFNHQIRFNNSHEFNNPFGKERSCYNPKMKQNLINFLTKLKNSKTEFTCCNFDSFNFDELSQNDFVYCDPPYLITTGTYNDGKRGFTGWNKNEELKLLSILEKLNENSIKFALSNVVKHKGKTNEILLNWINQNNFNVNFLQKNYSNSNYHTLDKNKNSTIEILVTNYKTENSKQNLLFA